MSGCGMRTTGASGSRGGPGRGPSAKGTGGGGVGKWGGSPTVRVVRASSLAAVHPIVVVLLDGLADRAHDELGGRTGVESARTPNLDALCAAGSCGVLYAIGPGRAPSSEVAHWSMLGYRPDEFPGRTVFEALGRGQDVSAEDVFAYAALRPAERRDHGWWLTGRPDPERDAEEAEQLVGRCDGLEAVENPHIDVALVNERLDAGDTFVYMHDKRIDQAGHTKDPNKKRAAVELLD